LRRFVMASSKPKIRGLHKLENRPFTAFLKRT
jgi:hypothetical protein